MEKEISLSSIGTEVLRECSYEDRYCVYSKTFYVKNTAVEVHDPILGEVLQYLPPSRRDVIYCGAFWNIVMPRSEDCYILLVLRLHTGEKQRLKSCMSYWRNDEMKRDKISYETILAAKRGDAEALISIVKHYEPEINAASKRIVEDEAGNRITIIDQDIKHRIESKLMLQVYKEYDPWRIPPIKRKR